MATQVTTTPPRTPNAVDLHVGARIRMRRKTLKMSQDELAEALGLTFQQVQKYENASNRVSSSKLWDIAQKLDVPIAFFFEGLSDEASGRVATDPVASITVTLTNTPGGIDLAEAFPRIPAGSRRQLVNLAQSMAEPELQAA